MSRYIVNGEVYIEHRFLKKTIKIEDGKLIILPPDAPIEDGAEVYNAAGKKVVPGFIDVHTHGAVGVDVNAATAEDYEKICRFAAGNGTTSWLCSVLTDTKEQTEWCMNIRNIRRWSIKEQIYLVFIWKDHFCLQSTRGLCRSIFFRKPICHF